MGSLESAYAKAEQAKVHLEKLQASVEAYRASEPHEFTRQAVDHLVQPEMVVVKFKVKIKEAPPADWGLIVGDVLSNLRAALDHALFGHASSRQALTEDQERALQYPVVTDATKWPRAQAKLAPFVDPAVLQAIEDSQPFKVQLPDWQFLALLNGLVNRDKHRQVRVVTYNNELFEITHTDADVVSIDNAPRELVDGAVVASVKLRRPDRQPGKPPSDVVAHLSVQFGYTENLELPVVGEWKSVTAVLPVLHRNVVLVLDNMKAAGA
ncbi:hypothetical protein [Mycolicibacterium setense]